MLTSFEVGSVFQIIDRASPVIAKLAREMTDFGKLVATTKKELQSLGNLKLGGLNTNLKTATDQVVALKDAAERAAGTIASSTKAAEASVQQLTAQWRNAEKAALAAGAAARGSVPSIGGRNPRQGISGAHSGGAGRSSWHLPSAGVPMPGGGHAGYRAGGDAEMAGALLIGAAALEEAKLEDSISLMLWHSSQAPTAANKKNFRDLIQTTASQTGFSYEEISKAATDEIRLLKGTPGRGLDILPEMLKAAATESRLKGTSLDNSMQALVGLAHMEKGYSAEEIKTMAPMFGFLSTANPQSLKQMETAASYAMPLLQSQLGMDPSDVLFSTTALARAGALNTKSGTWVRSAFERALPPDPRTMSEKAYARKMEEMGALGLVDGSGKSTVLDPSGKRIDIEKFLTTVRTHADSMDIATRNSMIKGVFGEQGARGVDMLMDPKVRQQEQALKGEFPEWKQKYATFMEDYSKQSPVQQFRQSWQDLLNVLTDIGTIALPGCLSGLKQFDDLLKFAASVLPTNPMKPGTLGNVAAHAATTAATGGAGVGGFMESIKEWWRGDAAKESIQQGSEKGTESGSAKGAEQGVISGFQKMSFQGGADNGALLKNINYETADGGGGFTTVNGVTVPNSAARSSGASGSSSDGVVPTGPGGGPLGKFPVNKRSVATIVADAWRKAGMSDAGIAGLMANIGEESAFNPTLRHADQPKFGGEAHFAHGLYQEGGTEWNHYAGWLAKNYPGSDWRDPKLQSEFAAWNLKTNYPGVWNRMSHGNREQAAEAYAAGYLKPAARYLASRIGKFRSHGVPGLESYIGTTPGTTDSDTASKAIRPKTDQEIHLHNSTILDGRVIAKNTAKHLAREGNGPARGGRMPDNLITRPLSI